MAVTVGFIGVGNMGNPMAYNVLKASFPMIVFDMPPMPTIPPASASCTSPPKVPASIPVTAP